MSNTVILKMFNCKIKGKILESEYEIMIAHLPIPNKANWKF